MSCWDPDPYRIKPRSCRKPSLPAGPAIVAAPARLLVVGERGSGPAGWPPGDPHPADLLRLGAFRAGPSAERLRRIGLGSPCAAANLLPGGPPGRWQAAERAAAARAARRLRADWGPRFSLVVLCGRQVAAAFGLARAPPGFLSERRFLVIPHPSGRARWWNLPGREAEVAARVLACLGSCAARPECCGGACY